MSGPKNAAAAELGALDGGTGKRITGLVVDFNSTAPICPLACGGRAACTWRCPVLLHDSLAEVVHLLGVAS
jgi:hypothetical protein